MYRRQKIEGSTTILGYRANYLHFPSRKAKAVLACFHGWLDNAGSFVPLAEQLPEYEIFAWDFLGHGKSAHKHAGERYHYIDLVPFIAAALQHIDRKDIVLVGHSMGAGAAALYTGAIGERVKSLVLVEGLSPITAEASEAPKILAEGVRAFSQAQALQKPVYASLDAALKIRMRVNNLSRNTVKPLVQRAIKKVKGGVTWRADFRLRAPSLVRMTQSQVKSILSQIEVPALLILGENGMVELTRVAESDRTLKKIFQIVRLPGGHHLHIESSAKVAAVIQEFLS